VGVVVFDSDVLIGFLSRDDAHHQQAVAWKHDATTPGTSRWLCAVNLAEILIGPIRAGVEDRVAQMLTQLDIETIPVDAGLARRAAAVRVETGLKLPDAFAVATARLATERGLNGVRLASFDNDVLRATPSTPPAPPSGTGPEAR
jgi:predicted nucleic acid-binding protein